MPTGYTYPVITCDQSFEGFLWHCALAFFHDLDPPIPLVAEPYGQEWLEREKDELATVSAMTDEQWAVEELRRKKEAEARWDASDDERRAENKKLEAMIAKVEAWQSPENETIVELKKFMLEQLRISLRDPPRPEFRTYASRSRSETIEQIKRNIARYEEEIRQETERLAERNEWVRLLNEAVPQPPVEEIVPGRRKQQVR